MELQIANAEEEMKLGLPIPIAFPRLKKPGVGGEFSGPSNALKALLNWIWLQAHKGADTEGVEKGAHNILARALQIYEIAESGMHRDRHDLLLLSAAILAGDRETISRSIEIVKEATMPASGPQYFASASGMVKFRLLNNEKEVARQFELFSAHKGKEAVVRIPKVSMFKAFVSFDCKAIKRGCHAVEREFWMRLGSGRPGVAIGATSVQLGVWDSNRYWPWPECVLLRILRDQCPHLEADPFWIPRSLLLRADFVRETPQSKD